MARLREDDEASLALSDLLGLLTLGVLCAAPPCTPYSRRELQIDPDLEGRPRAFSFLLSFQAERRAV